MEQPTQTRLSGQPQRLSLAVLYEMIEQQKIAKFVAKNQSLLQIVLPANLVGKVHVFGTSGEMGSEETNN